LLLPRLLVINNHNKKQTMMATKLKTRLLVSQRSWSFLSAVAVSTELDNNVRTHMIAFFKMAF
jgi:hypothetical protein